MPQVNEISWMMMSSKFLILILMMSCLNFFFSYNMIMSTKFSKKFSSKILY